MAASELKTRARIPGVPVFGYHGMDDVKSPHPAREQKYWVQSSEFRKQLACVRRNGNVIRLEDLHAGSAAPEFATGAAVLTFDDGLASQYERAFPLLTEFSAPACFFVNTANVGRAGFLSWSQITEMHLAGLSFGSHSHDHVYLTRLDTAAVLRQLKTSREILENQLGCPVRFLSVPFGDTSRRVMEAALAAGYQAVCTSHNWPAKPGASVINRVAVGAMTSTDDFARLLACDRPSYWRLAAREAALRAPKRILLRFWPAPAPSGSQAALEEE